MKVGESPPRIEIEFGPDWEERYIKACVEVIQRRENNGGVKDGRDGLMVLGNADALRRDGDRACKSDIPA